MTAVAGLWVLSGPGLPCGARILPDSVLGPAGDGRAWLDVCMLGQHLPQMYRTAETRDLHPEGCARLGLCPDCLGFGDLNPAPVTDPLRAEVTALTGLLISKGVFTQQEFADALEAEAKMLDHDYEETYPGWRTTADGLSMRLPEAAETMRKLGFPL